MAQAPDQLASKKEKEEKKRKWEDINESLKFVCERGKVMCPLCSVPIGGLKVTSNTISLQDTPWTTTGDNNGKINFDFKGTCTHPSQKSPPCKAVISLGKWKNYSDVHINSKYALLRKSTIPCLISGQDIRIIHSGQMAMLTKEPYIKMKRLIISQESNQINAIHVCYKLEYNAIYRENGEDKENGNIRWKVKIGEAEDVELEDVKEIIKNDCLLAGEKIYFPVPMEWRYKKIFLTAYVKNDEEVDEVTGMEIFIKDHIIAAFYRVNNKNAIPFEIRNVEKQSGTGNWLAMPESDPIYHIQGMYKEGNQYFFTGSTNPNTPAYVLSINECDCPGGYENYNVIQIKGEKVSLYTHPGGLQSANGVLAVGLEKYNGGTTEKNTAILCFFDTIDMKEIVNTQITLEDRASAVGIVGLKDRWIIAVRKNDSAVGFYYLKKDKDGGQVKSTIGNYKEVGNFQNLNLFLNEEDNIYMFGMDSTKIPVVGDGSGTNHCWMYRLDYYEVGEAIEFQYITAVWIDKDGYFQEKNYRSTKENNIKFTTKTPASFQWASCVSLQKNKNTGVDEERKEDPDFIGNEATGFLGKFSLYASANNVKGVPVKKEGVKYTVRKEPSYQAIQCNLFEEE